MSDIIRPIEPFELTQGFGENPSNYKRFGLAGHNGWDLRTKYPDTPQGHRNIFASFYSKLFKVGDEGNDGFGKYFEVTVKLNSTWKLTYAHCLSIESFTTKNEGEVMAISDSTGNSTGSHLHLTVKKGVLSGGAFVSDNYNNGYFGAVNPQEFFDELREYKNNHATIPQPTAQSVQITDSTKIPGLDNKEVQQIRAELEAKNRKIADDAVTIQRAIKDAEEAIRDAREIKNQYDSLSAEFKARLDTHSKPNEAVEVITTTYPASPENPVKKPAVIEWAPIITNLLQYLKKYWR